MKKDKIITIIVGVVLAIAAAITGAVVNINIEDGKINANIEYSEESQPVYLEDDKGELFEMEDVPTVEEVDGGYFEDRDTGVSTLDGEYDDLGAVVETFDTSTPEAFKNATLGKCVYANNRWGAQCVSLARSFWHSYANRDVSTCGTGMAKGMMKCADQNAGQDFIVYWAENKNIIQAGDWLVFDGGQYGHVGMALGPVVNGYVALLGENQGGGYCEGGGSATNIINISIKNLIGFYRPKSYVKPEPKPTPTPTPEPKAEYIVYKVKKGDTLGAILRAQGYKGKNLFGDKGIAQKVAEDNGIKNRGLIYPNEEILIKKDLLK